MAMGVQQGETVTLAIDGPNEDELGEGCWNFLRKIFSERAV